MNTDEHSQPQTVITVVKVSTIDGQEIVLHLKEANLDLIRAGLVTDKFIPIRDVEDNDGYVYIPSKRINMVTVEVVTDSE